MNQCVIDFLIARNDIEKSSRSHPRSRSTLESRVHSSVSRLTGSLAHSDRAFARVSSPQLFITDLTDWGITYELFISPTIKQ